MSTPAWRRRLKVTKLGWWFMGLTLGIGLAAINTGNNLLFLVLGMLLASIVISGVLWGTGDLAHLLARDRAVHGDLVPFDVLENAIVGGWRPPRVVFRLQAID